MILVLTNSLDRTADYLCEFLDREGVPLWRLDTDLLANQIKFYYRDWQVSIVTAGRAVTPDLVAHLWYRRPANIAIDVPAIGSEADYLSSEWAEAIEAFLAHVPRDRWMNHPARNAKAQNKLEQLGRARAMGFRVPRTIVTQDIQDLTEFWTRCNGKLVAKPLASGYVDTGRPETSGLVYTSVVSQDDVDNPDMLVTCPTLFQEQIEKSLDIRVCVVDEALHAVGMKRIPLSGFADVDIRADNFRNVIHGKVLLPPDVCCKLVRLVHSYGLRFAAIDLVMTSDGSYVFLELNPNGQWAWLDLLGAADIAKSFLSAFRVSEVPDARMEKH